MPCFVGKSPSTLLRWDREGRLKPKRSAGNQRYYTDSDLQKALNIETDKQCVDEWISEVGGGLNFKRKKFLKLMKGIRLGEVSKVIIAHKDRLVRFSFEFIEEFAS